ncbi:MAG: hypothetical protein ACM3U1_00875 [Chloroflexota bacterium]
MKIDNYNKNASNILTNNPEARKKEDSKPAEQKKAREAKDTLSISSHQHEKIDIVKSRVENGFYNRPETLRAAANKIWDDIKDK